MSLSTNLLQIWRQILEQILEIEKGVSVMIGEEQISFKGGLLCHVGDNLGWLF